MNEDAFINSASFLLFVDENLRDNACQAVERFLRDFSPVDNSQLYSIPSVIQAGGLSGLRFFMENQKRKNTNEKNKNFWGFLDELVFSVPGSSFSLRACLQKEMQNRGLLADEEKSSENIQAKRIRESNKVFVDKLINHVLAVYFEHFNCHYFYKTNQGVAHEQS
jgi:hypothetical protein